MLELAGEGIFVLDDSLRFLRHNTSFLRLTGLSGEQLAGADLSLVLGGVEGGAFMASLAESLRAHGSWMGEVRRTGAADRQIVEQLVIFREEIPGDGPARIYGRLRDVTELRKKEEELSFKSSHDGLTGLPGRALFLDTLAKHIACSDGSSYKTAVFVLDLNDFKRVNERSSYATGSKLLSMVSERLVDVMRSRDCVGRTGGDEFAVVAPLLGRLEEASEIARRVVDAMSLPFEVGGREFSLQATVGCSVYPEHGAEAETLLDRADLALRHARTPGRCSWHMYDPGIFQGARHQTELEEQLRDAIDSGGIRVHYQPLVRLDSGELEGAEALARWAHPVRGELKPAQFIPMAEETGLIVSLGARVFREACAQQKRWKDDAKPDWRIAVNCSSLQLEHPEFLESFVAIVEELGVDPKRIGIEITESCIMEDVQKSAELLGALKRMGFHLSVDDFGTGYSSFQYIRDLPVDVLKIDQSFVRRIDESNNDRIIVGAIVSMAHSLGISVVAEGVEREGQHAILKELGCDLAQGYFYGAAQEAEAFARYG